MIVILHRRTCVLRSLPFERAREEERKEPFLKLPAKRRVVRRGATARDCGRTFFNPSFLAVRTSLVV